MRVAILLFAGLTLAAARPQLLPTDNIRNPFDPVLDAFNRIRVGAMRVGERLVGRNGIGNVMNAFQREDQRGAAPNAPRRPSIGDQMMRGLNRVTDGIRNTVQNLSPNRRRVQQ